MCARAAGTIGRAAFVTLEGGDGCGKSTQVAMLSDALVAAGVGFVHVREPGGTPIGEKIRGLLLDPGNAEMSPECELMLYEAARAQLVREVVEPALAAGTLVLCDRFHDSTTAYQAGGRMLDAGMVGRANALGTCGVVPDRTLVFDLDPDVALSRADGGDRLEAEGVAFQRRVHDAYLRLAAAEPDRVRLVDATGTPDEVHARVVEALLDVVPALGGGGSHVR